MNNKLNTKASDELGNIDPFADLYLAALRQLQDQSLLITFFQLPRRIRRLIVQSLEARNSSLRQAFFGSAFNSIYWIYREEVDMHDYELEIEQYLINLSKASDLGANIFINRLALVEIHDQFKLFAEFYESEQ